jgi:hypothetical protein
MKNDLRKESNLYKNSNLLYVVSTFTIWYLYIQHNYEGVYKWYIMPCTAYISSYIILSILIYICTELSMDKYLLNHRIYKCIEWQQKNKTKCTNKRFSKCIVDPKIIKNWNDEPIIPEKKQPESPYTPQVPFEYYKPSQYTAPNFTQLASTTTPQSNKPPPSYSDVNIVKPGNYFIG